MNFLDSFLEEPEEGEKPKKEKPKKVPKNALSVSEEKRVQKYVAVLNSNEEEHKFLEFLLEFIINENFRQKVIHLETIGMMTKYQLVFIKLETSLVKIGFQLKLKENRLKAAAFHKLFLVMKPMKAKMNLMAGVIYFNFEQKLNKFTLILKRVEFLSLTHGFVKLKTLFHHNRAHQALKEKLKTMKDEFISKLRKKELDIQSIKKNIKSQEESYNNLKSHELELVKALNTKSKILASLELKRKTSPSYFPLAASDSNAKKIKFYEEKIKELEGENADLRLKINSTEGNVVVFVKEMSELLDCHEISTNNDSQDLNFSNSGNPALEDPTEIDRFHKIRGWTQKNAKRNKILLSQENLLVPKK